MAAERRPRVRLDQQTAYREVRQKVQGGMGLEDAYREVAAAHGVSPSTVAHTVRRLRPGDPDWAVRARRPSARRGFDHEAAYAAVRQRVGGGEPVMRACRAVGAEMGASPGAVWQVVLHRRASDPKWPAGRVRMGAPATFDHDEAYTRVRKRVAGGEGLTSACRAVGGELGVKPSTVYNVIRKRRPDDSSWPKPARGRSAD